jgi:hypothetical protein
MEPPPHAKNNAMLKSAAANGIIRLIEKLPGISPFWN